MPETKAKVNREGRIIIPVEYRKLMGIQPGDEVILILERGELRILTPHQRVKRSQALVRQYISPGRLLSEELIQERREEASRE